MRWSVSSSMSPAIDHSVLKSVVTAGYANVGQYDRLLQLITSTYHWMNVFILYDVGNISVPSFGSWARQLNAGLQSHNVATVLRTMNSSVPESYQLALNDFRGVARGKIGTRLPDWLYCLTKEHFHTCRSIEQGVLKLTYCRWQNLFADK